MYFNRPTNVKETLLNGKRGKDTRIALAANKNEKGKTNFNDILLFFKMFKPINPLRRISGKIPSTYLPIGLPKRDGISDSYFTIELIALPVANKIIKIKEIRKGQIILGKNTWQSCNKTHYI